MDNFRYIERIYKDQTAINELNSYRNWNIFGLQAEPVWDDGNDNGGYKDQEEFMDNTFWTRVKNSQYLGTKSLFNNSHAVSWGSGEDGKSGYRIPTNAPLLDSNAVRQAIRDRGGCSIRELCEASANNQMGRAIYNYSDFMYCKHLGKISNNYLITLRRFPFPCGDHINYTDPIKYEKIGGNMTRVDTEWQQHMPDAGRLVTWMGTPGNDMSEILKYNVHMPYKEMNSEIHTMQGNAESGGLLGALCNMTSSQYSAKVLRGEGGDASISFLKSRLGSATGNLLAGPPDSSWRYHQDRSKPYGPVDVIASTHIRQGAGDGGGGLKFEQNIKLQFDYELRAYDGINTRAAMIDLISNILAVTYTDGKFWGGGYRYNGPSQSSLFTNLPIFKLGENGNLADMNSIKDALSGSISQIGTAMGGGGLHRPTSIRDFFNMAKSLLGGIGRNIGNILAGGALNALGRPQKEGVDSLLNNNPVGLWHLTIGNPKHPIMSMGNMILDDVEIQPYGPLGLDDMPTGVKVNISLKHGMPRDRRQIEYMYQGGDFRSYIPMGQAVGYMYREAEELLGKDELFIIDKSTSDKSDVKDKASNTVAYKDTMEIREPLSSVKNRFMKFFGTDKFKMIKITAEEAHLGSSKALSADKAKKIYDKAKTSLKNV